MFYGDGSLKSWTKPVGVSQIYMLLIGGGGSGDGGVNYGGNSGNVVTWFGAAQNVPDVLLANAGSAQTNPSASGGTSSILYRGTSLVTLLIANGGNFGGTANSANAATVFGNSGFYQSTTGQTGGTFGGVSPSTTTFLSAAPMTSGLGNYGYQTSTNGCFLLQPIIVGLAGQDITGAVAGIGCGCGSSQTKPGAGFILIASW